MKREAYLEYSILHLVSREKIRIPSGVSHCWTFPLVGRTCAFGAKNRVFFEGNKFVTIYTERSKKILKLTVFGVGVSTQMIDFLPKLLLLPEAAPVR